MIPAKPALPAPAITAGEQGMKIQTALIPFAILGFGIALPIFVWAGSYAPNAAWMSACLAVFAIGWAAFYGVYNWLKTPAAADLRRRARLQILGGLLWSGAVLSVAVFGHFAGPARETLLLLALGAAMVCVVFCTPWLPSLLIVAPAALAGPLFALFLHPEDVAVARLGLAATALALALALLVNRILRGQYALAAERELLLAERAEQAEAARRFARVKSELADTLSEELRDGLTGVAHVLAAATHSRAAPTRAQVGVALDAVNELLAIVGGPAAAASGAGGEPPSRRLRILTLEPDPLSAAALRASLEQLGHQIVSTSQTARAVELARICDLDLMICGEHDAIPTLRALPGGAGATPVVALVGQEVEDAEAALAAGADAILRRPFAIPAAARAIAEALASAPAANDRAAVA